MRTANGLHRITTIRPQTPYSTDTTHIFEIREKTLFDKRRNFHQIANSLAKNSPSIDEYQNKISEKIINQNKPMTSTQQNKRPVGTITDKVRVKNVGTELAEGELKIFKQQFEEEVQKITGKSDKKAERDPTLDTRTRPRGTTQSGQDSKGNEEKQKPIDDDDDNNQRTQRRDTGQNRDNRGPDNKRDSHESRNPPDEHQDNYQEFSQASGKEQKHRSIVSRSTSPGAPREVYSRYPLGEKTTDTTILNQRHEEHPKTIDQPRSERPDVSETRLVDKNPNEPAIRHDRQSRSTSSTTNRDPSNQSQAQETKPQPAIKDPPKKNPDHSNQNASDSGRGSSKFNPRPEPTPNGRAVAEKESLPDNLRISLNIGFINDPSTPDSPGKETKYPERIDPQILPISKNDPDESTVHRNGPQRFSPSSNYNSADHGVLTIVERSTPTAGSDPSPSTRRSFRLIPMKNDEMLSQSIHKSPLLIDMSFVRSDRMPERTPQKAHERIIQRNPSLSDGTSKQPFTEQPRHHHNKPVPIGSFEVNEIEVISIPEKTKDDHSLHEIKTHDPSSVNVYNKTPKPIPKPYFANEDVISPTTEVNQRVNEDFGNQSPPEIIRSSPRTPRAFLLPALNSSRTYVFETEPLHQAHMQPSRSNRNFLLTSSSDRTNDD